MPTIPSLPFSEPTSPISPTNSRHLTSRPPSPTSLQRNRLSASVPNIAGLARADPLQPPSCPLEIRLSSDVVVLRCTGNQTTEPASLTGSVILHLAGATAIKGVALKLLAKAKVALPLNERPGRTPPQTTVLFERDWDFLEGDKSHHHTLRAGIHEWPFTIELDGSAPSSIYADTGHASIIYTFHAIAIRPTFSTNYVTSKIINVVRAPSTETLEYQQTLEIENMWPEKIMYHIIIPHKAWAAGDYLSAMLKFTLLTKGVGVISVEMSIQEKVKTLWRSLYHEDLRVVACTQQSIHHSQFVRIRTTSEMESAAEPPLATQPSFVSRARARSRENLRSTYRVGGSARQNTSGGSTPASIQSQVDSENNSSPARSRNSAESEVVESGSGDIEGVVRLFIPPTATPSHGISPIEVSHRVKWNILIANSDGHYSELRCSLPIQLLDHVILEEAQAATSITRGLLFGSDYEPDNPQEAVLPSYPDHIRDRVADAALHAALLANNPLTTDAHLPEDDVPAENILPSPRGPTSTFSATNSLLNIPRATSLPDASERGHLEESYSSELVHSLGRDLYSPPSMSAGPTPPESRNVSRQGSRNSSRNSSRAPSPEPVIPGEPLELHISSASSHRPRIRRKFSLKPFAPFSKRSKFTTTIDAFQPSTSSMTFPSTPSCSNTPNSELLDPFHDPGRSGAVPSTVNLSHLNVYDTVPDYTISANGFLGGGITPLSGLQGLPSYDEAERVQGATPMDTSHVRSVDSSDYTSSHAL